jgi:ferrous iron transport protein A
MADADYPLHLATVPLDQLPRGTVGRVVSVGGDLASDAITQRLYEMGFEPGISVELTHTGPLGGDPLAVKVGAMTVALRKAEAARIVVQHG